MGVDFGLCLPLDCSALDSEVAQGQEIALYQDLKALEMTGRLWALRLVALPPRKLLATLVTSDSGHLIRK